MLDIFNQDAFSVTSLTAVVNELKYRPNRLRQLGLFTTEGVSTLSVGIERIGDTIQLIKPSPRGTVGEARDDPKRTIENITIPHFSRPWHVYADEVQGVRALGSETQLETVQNVVAGRMNRNMSDFEVTEEYTRLGAITGIITYADGSTLNLYTKFGIAVPDPVNFDLNVAWSDANDGRLRALASTVIRKVRAAVGGLNFDYVHAFVGDTFFEKLLGNKEVRDTYKGWNQAQILRESYIGPNRSSNPMFEFGGIVWENYGAINSEGDGSLLGIGANDARFVPIGLPGLFQTYYGPADYMETVNTIGVRLYSKQERMKFDKGILGEMQSNALSICVRPGVLFKGTVSA